MKRLIVSALAACAVGAAVWLAEANDLPSATRVFQEAIAAQDTPTLIRSLIGQMKEGLEKNDDTFPDWVRRLEDYTRSCPDTASVALLHSMTAEMYQAYYDRNRWKIAGRTDLQGYVPDDLREWTPNLFEAKVKEELDASLQPAELLGRTPVGQYAAILEPGKDDRLRPTLYDLLLARAVELRPDSATYARWERFRRADKAGNPEAWMRVRLAQIAYAGSLLPEKEQPQIRHWLDSLLADGQLQQPFSNAIRDAQAAWWNRLPRWNRTETEQDAIIRKILTICDEGIRLYPEDTSTDPLRNLRAQLLQSTLQVNFPKQLYPGKPLTLRMHYNNAEGITVRIYKSLRRPEEAWKEMGGETKRLRGAEVKRYALAVRSPHSYAERDTTYTLAAELPLGLYECEVSLDGKAVSNSYCFSVSRLALVYRGLENGRKELLITDAESGKPQAGATVRYYRSDQSSGLPVVAGHVVTGKEGLAEIGRFRDLQCLRPLLGADSFAVWTPTYANGIWQGEQMERTELSLFTDRGMYRPGQTVFVKGIAYVAQSDTPHTAAEQQVALTLRDANGQEVATKHFTTDRFGAFNGEFALPKEGLNGMYRLDSPWGGCSFRVEEYKRPTFRLAIDSLKEEITFGQAVQLRGEATTFSGVSLTGGEVSWRIIRRPFWLRDYLYDAYRQNTEQVAAGKVSVESTGRFTIPFTPQAPERTEEGGERPVAADYELVATLTDSKGETQEARYLFSVANVGLLLQVDVPRQMETATANARFSAQTVNRHPVEAEGSYTLYALSGEEEGTIDARGEIPYAVTDTVRRGTFHTRQSLDPAFFESLPSGRYRLTIEAKDRQGKRVEASGTFLLYRKTDKRPPVFMPTWLVEERTECLPGEEATFLFGTSYAHTYILYELYSEDAKRLHCEWIRLDNENRMFRIPFLPTYGKGVTATFTFVKAGTLQTRSVALRLRMPDRRLTIVPETFRDYLLPGAREQWKFKVLDADSANVTAQLLAGMYDASLDKITASPFRWYFSPEPHFSLRYPSFREGSAFGRYTKYGQETPAYRRIVSPTYAKIDWQGVLDDGIVMRGYGRQMNSMLTGAVRMKAATMETLSDQLSDAVLQEDQVLSHPEAAPQASLSEEENGVGELPMQIRKDLVETAFFFPALTTDEAGETTFSFTMPESNTTWKLQLLAHTEQLHYGLLTREVVTNKPLMVSPNLPRFLREGDEVTLSMQVINHTDSAQAGIARLEFFDPESGKLISSLQFQQQPFALAADSMATVRWTVRVPQGLSLVGCRLSAGNRQGSDGEQHLLPVLSNRLLVTESIPFYLSGKEEQRIHLKQPKGSRPFRYTLEVSANPVWYAVQALPTLADPAEEDILSWFASYYCNTLASYIAQSHPRIRRIIDAWTAQGGDAGTLLSNLEKNEELKQLLLEETPWVLEAKEETEQKRRLALLFDLNRTEARRTAALNRLQAEQNADGGWSWFKGFPYSSRPITQAILKGMAQLVELGAVQYGQAEKEMQLRALGYLDRCIQKDYEEDMRLLRNAEPTADQIDYLFVRSSYRDIPEPAGAREAIRSYTDGAARSWKRQSLYSRAETASLLFRNGQGEQAGEILAWLRKTATTDREKGMYWANNRQENDYFHSPVEIHAMLMSAFREIAPDRQENDRMKQWLLSQKRTQRWESVPATLYALHALLLTGSDWLDEENICTASWGGRDYTTESGETATGYIKAFLSETEITPAAGSLTVRKESGMAPAWGAVYNQYYQTIDRIGKQGGALAVEKKLFIEEMGSEGQSLRPVDEHTALHVGQKVVVRLVLRNDRDRDYVVLKDLRAGCFEPAGQLSGCVSQDGIWFYRSPKDVSENFFFDRLPAGTFVLEYAAYVSRTGDYAGGISTVQCLYAPEYTSHTEGIRLKVE